MRFRFVSLAILLAIASRGDGRPKDPDPLDASKEAEATKAPSPSSTDRSGSLDSRNEQHRKLKDIQSMDQSLRTVATQLLNATAKHDDVVRIPDERIVTIETPIHVVHVSSQIENQIKEKPLESSSSKMKFGIPENSKYSNFEITNPGHAMPLTEEEIERELAMASTSTQKKQPTTTSMLSTWIQLYPPSTTTQGNSISEDKIDLPSVQIHSSTTTKLPSSTVKQNFMSTKPYRKAEVKTTTPSTQKPTESSSTTKVTKNPSTISTSSNVKISTTLSSVSTEKAFEATESTSKNPQTLRTTISNSNITKSAPSTKRPSAKITTPKIKSSTQKNPSSKPLKINNGHRIKPFSTKRPPIIKNDTVTSTSKIDKVTLSPSTTLSVNRTNSTDKPYFVTKIKATVPTEAQKQTSTTTSTTKPVHAMISKVNFTTYNSTVTKVPSPSHVNNILKVHVKRPIDDSTKIEIHPIKVNPPVLTIEKIGESSSVHKINAPDILESSKIDRVKFDFNTNVEVYTSTTERSLSSLSKSVTKRPRHSHKRKKHKNRRRRPTTTTTTTTTTTLSTPTSDSSDSEESLTTDSLSDLFLTEFQESKIEPETKVPPSKKKKPSSQTQIQKPFGTQIYNFLSREVMPSVGVMSLVGLGLGLASYFLYPFSGVISRRNYEVEPNYKYNLDEYGGNYGLSEEEVLSKVYSGMTGGQHHETKYNPSNEKKSNYYRYSVQDQPQQQLPVRYSTASTKNHGNRVIYRPVETTAYDVNYRNTEFKYPDLPTTPNYYDRQRQQQQRHPTDFLSTVGKVAIGHNRQFVVGNVPKEYSSAEDKLPDVLPAQDKSDNNLQFRVNEKYTEEDTPIPLLKAVDAEDLANPVTLIPKVDGEPSTDVFGKIQNTPAAVAVEHGPRAMKFEENVKMGSSNSRFLRRKRGILPDLTGSFIPLAFPVFKNARIERNSVIQVIPSKSEIEKERKEEEQEEDLSNEILDIIDDALPGKSDHHRKKYDAKTDKQNSKNILKASNKGSVNNAAIKSTINPSAQTDASSTSGHSEKRTSPSSSATATTTTSTTTTAASPTEPGFVDLGETTLDWGDNVGTTAKPKPPAQMNIFSVAKKIAEVKLRLGLTLLKHASENFARYIGHIQKRFNGEE